MSAGFGSRAFDVVVIGGGPAGAAAAIVACDAGLRTLLLERTTNDAAHIGETLPAAAGRYLSVLGGSTSFEEHHHLPSYGTASAWGDYQLQHTDALLSPYGHGWHLDRARFDTALRSHAAAAGAIVHRGVWPAGVERCGNARWMLTTAGSLKQKVATRWIVDASGRTAWLTSRLGVRRQTHDRQLAITATFAARGGDNDRDTLTLVEAVEEGWWYTARIPGGRRVTAFHTDPDCHACRDGRTLSGYRRLLDATAHIRQRLEPYGAQSLEPPRATMANSARLARPCGAGWVSVGDAAASYDPLSSRGIIEALDTGLLAGRAVVQEAQGVTGAVTDYADRMAIRYAAYLRDRTRYYLQERRWPGSPYWSRRTNARVLTLEELS